MGLELLAQKKHANQFNLIPNELSDEFDGVPVAIANQGYSYHLWGDIKMKFRLERTSLQF